MVRLQGQEIRNHSALAGKIVQYVVTVGAVPYVITFGALLVFNSVLFTISFAHIFVIDVIINVVSCRWHATFTTSRFTRIVCRQAGINTTCG